MQIVQKNKNIALGLLLVLSLFYMVFTPTPAFATSLGEDWSSIKSLFSDAKKSDGTTTTDAIAQVDAAHLIYVNSFKIGAAASDDAGSDSDDLLIENAFEDIVRNLTSSDYETASLNMQVIDKTIYKIAYVNMESSVGENNADDFLSWYSVLDKKFKVSEKDFESNRLVPEIKSDPSSLSFNGPLVLDEMLAVFKLKTLEELDEAVAALDAGDIKSAKKLTYEGLYYYRTLHPAVESKLGADSANELLHQMREAIRVTMGSQSPPEMKMEIEHIASKVELLIREYEGGNISEIGLALSGIKDRLYLVEGEYLDAVSDGEIINQVEYDETVIFLERVRSIYDSVKSSLMDLSESDSQSLEENLTEMDLVVSSKGKTSAVSILVGKSLNNVAALETLAGVEEGFKVDIFHYFDEIERLLTQMKTVYRDGDSTLALDLASEAYLDNYEFIEGPLGEVDHDLMEKIEIDMREDLRNMIKNGESPDVVDAQADMIVADLAMAKMVVPEFASITLVVLAAAIASVILLSSKLRPAQSFAKIMTITHSICIESESALNIHLKDLRYLGNFATKIYPIIFYLDGPVYADSRYRDGLF